MKKILVSECLYGGRRPLDAMKTIAEYGIDTDEFIRVIPKMAHDAIASGSPKNTQKDVTEEDIIKIYYSLVG